MTQPTPKPVAVLPAGFLALFGCLVAGARSAEAGQPIEPAGAAAPQEPSTELPLTVELSTGWRFLGVAGGDLPGLAGLGDSDPALWRRVDLPVDARPWLVLPELEESAEEAEGEPATDRAARAWYEKGLRLNDLPPGTVQQLLFDGVDGVADVYLDEQFLWTQDAPGLPFRIEVSGLLRAGETHLLRVLTRPRAGELECGGLLGGVRLIVEGPLRLAGGSDAHQLDAPEPVAAWTGVHRGPELRWGRDAEGQPKLWLRTKVVNGTARSQDVAVVHQVFDEEGAAQAFTRSKIETLDAGSALWNETELTFPDGLAWTPLDPRRLRVETLLYSAEGVIDQHVTWSAPRAAEWRVGQGWVQGDRSQGDRPFAPVGVSYVPELPGVGRALTGPAWRRDLVRIGQMGAEWIFVPALPELQVLRQCSTVGLHLIAEVPARPTREHAAYLLAAGHQPCLLGLQIAGAPGAEDVAAWRSLVERTAPQLVLGGAFDGAAWAPFSAEPTAPSSPGDAARSQLAELGEALSQPSNGPLIVQAAFAPNSEASAPGAVASGALGSAHRTPTWGLHALRGWADPERVGWSVYPATDWLAGDASRTVRVFSNCPEIALFLDDRELGRLERPVGPGVWGADFEDVAYAPGALRAVGYADGAEVMQRQVRTPGDAVGLQCVADLMGVEVQADGADAITVHALVVDALGQRVPDYDGELTFRVRGSGRVVGAHRVRAVDGLASVTVRSVTVPGSVQVAVDAAGLRGGDALFNAR